MTKDKKNKIKATELDAKFDRGESIIEYMDLSQAVKRVNVDFPAWSIGELDKEAERLGIARQALIKLWVIEKLDQLSKGREKKVSG